MSQMEFEQCFHRQVEASGEPLLQAYLPGLILKVLVGLVVELLMILDKVQNVLLVC